MCVYRFIFIKICALLLPSERKGEGARAASPTRGNGHQLPPARPTLGVAPNPGPGVEPWFLGSRSTPELHRPVGARGVGPCCARRAQSGGRGSQGPLASAEERAPAGVPAHAVPPAPRAHGPGPRPHGLHRPTRSPPAPPRPAALHKVGCSRPFLLRVPWALSPRRPRVPNPHTHPHPHGALGRRAGRPVSWPGCGRSVSAGRSCLLAPALCTAPEPAPVPSVAAALCLGGGPCGGWGSRPRQWRQAGPAGVAQRLGVGLGTTGSGFDPQPRAGRAGLHPHVGCAGPAAHDALSSLPSLSLAPLRIRNPRS